MERRKAIVTITLGVVLVVTACQDEFPRVSNAGQPTPQAVVTQTPLTPESETPAQNPSLLEDFENTAHVTDYSYEIPTPPDFNEDSLKKGRELYDVNCARCHGAALKGDSQIADLEPSPTDLTRIANYKYGHDPKSLYLTTAYGIEGTSMAPWDGLITPNDIWAICFYLESKTETP